MEQPTYYTEVLEIMGEQQPDRSSLTEGFRSMVLAPSAGIFLSMFVVDLSTLHCIVNECMQGCRFYARVLFYVNKSNIK